jgi:hypothetical protein
MQTDIDIPKAVRGLGMNLAWDRAASEFLDFGIVKSASAVPCGALYFNRRLRSQG